MTVGTGTAGSFLVTLGGVDSVGHTATAQAGNNHPEARDRNRGKRGVARVSGQSGKSPPERSRVTL